jgi:type I restriction enzyme S subunit
MAANGNVKFREICEHSAFGPRFSSADYDPNGNVATLRTTDISADGRIEYSTMPIAQLDLGKFEQHLLRKDDLVITRTGRVGTTAVFSSYKLPVLPGAFLIRFRLKPSLADPKFYCYFFNSPEGQALISSVATGSVQQNLNITGLHGIDVPLPPLADQKAIAAVLGTLDDKIELNRRMNARLEAIARALFQSWFVDFDPVRAKLDGRRPTALDPSTAALFPNEFADSELGPIPKGWDACKISDMCTTQYGYTASATDDLVGPQFLRVMDINKQDWIGWSSVPYCEMSDEDKQRYVLSIGDIVVARMADPGKSAIVEQKIDAVFASYLVRLKTLSLGHAYYLYYWLKSPAYTEYSVGAMSGSVQKNMNAKVIVAADLLLPPSSVIQAFLERVLPLRKRITANLSESHTLAAIRDALLPKLLSGEITLKEPK